MSARGQSDDDALLSDMQRHVDVLLRHRLTSAADQRLIGKWSGRTRQAFASLVAPDGRLNRDALRNFRRDQILVDDIPGADISGEPLRNRVVGWRRANRQCLLQCLAILRRYDYDELLRKYPCALAGNPHRFHHDGYSYTFRWARHVYSLGLLKQTLGEHLGNTPTLLDIGSSYGIFSGLVKWEYPGSHHVLIDLSEQLILAHYFLGRCFPEARIAGPADLLDVPIVTREFLQEYDFVLMPSFLSGRLARNSVDLTTNFSSFCEMTREYFEDYLQLPAFLSSRYLLTINRVAASPDRYGNDICVLDYPIWDRSKRLHFDICAMYSVDYLFATRATFWYTLTMPPPHFEYVGRLHVE